MTREQKSVNDTIMREGNQSRVVVSEFLNQINLSILDLKKQVGENTVSNGKAKVWKWDFFYFPPGDNICILSIFQVGLIDELNNGFKQMASRLDEQNNTFQVRNHHYDYSYV